MSWQRALNEVQGLLTQSGVPTNHSQDIVARFTAAMSDYYDFRANQARSQEVTSDSASSSAFQNAFRSPEEYSGGTPGAAGAAGAGAYAWAAGKDGKDGVDGGGDDGSGNNGGGGSGGGVQVFLPPVGNTTQCAILKSLLKSCGICSDPCKSSKGSAGQCSTGKYAGQDVCSILDQQAKELDKQRRKLEELEDKVKAIEKQLKDTVDCP
jgi:hypothetical protein